MTIKKKKKIIIVWCISDKIKKYITWGLHKVLKVWKMLNFNHCAFKCGNMLECECAP